MRARINAPLGYRCAPDGKAVLFFPEGSEVTGQVAMWALADFAAVAVYDPREETKIETVPEIKAEKPKRRGRPRKVKE